eukprot:5895605-Prymnesium_polylepis.1
MCSLKHQRALAGGGLGARQWVRRLLAGVVSRVFRGCFARRSFTSFTAVSQLFRAVSQRIRT